MNTKKWVVCWKPRSNCTVKIISQPMTLKQATLKAMVGNRKYPDSPHWVEEYKSE